MKKNLQLILISMLLFIFSGCGSAIITPAMFNTKKESTVINGSPIGYDHNMLIMPNSNRYRRTWTPTAYLGQNGKIYYEIKMSHDKDYNRLYTIYPEFKILHYMYDKDEYIKESKNINRSSVVYFSEEQCIDAVMGSPDNKGLVVDCASISNIKDKKFLYLIRIKHFYQAVSGAIEYIDLSQEVLSVISKFEDGDMSFLDDEAESRVAKIFINKDMILYMLSQMTTKEEIYQLHEKVGILELYSDSLKQKFDKKLNSIL